MSHISYPFKKTNKAVFQKPSNVLSSESTYWKKLGAPVLVKEFGAIDHIDFSPVEPYYFAATCSVRVQIYDPITKTVVKNISKFVEGAYGAKFRADGKLLIAGSEESVVKLFDVQSKNVLRVFAGHTAPVHRTTFTKDQKNIISFSDDKSVALWDIATEEKLITFSEHSDYIRTGAASPVSPEIIMSGSYDHTVKLYDCRSNETVLSVNHGNPVESTLFLPSGGIFISAGGTEMKVWDIFNGGKLLANISNHHKTITVLQLACNNSRIMSASLDRHVKIYDVSTFKEVHNINYPNAIISMGVSQHDDVLAVGMVDGVISIKKKDKPSHGPEEIKRNYKFAPHHTQASVDLVVKNEKQDKVSKYDVYLRKMEYSKALAAVIKPYVAGHTPERTVTLIQELLRRNVLNKAMNGLTENQIGELLKFLGKNIGVMRFTTIVLDAVNVFVDVFGNRVKSFCETNLWLYNTLINKIQLEIDVSIRCCELEGVTRQILAAAQDRTEVELEEHSIAPSSTALKELVIDV